MSFIILVNAFFGLTISLLYYPDSPLYIFPTARLEEFWLWSKYAAFFSALLFIFALLSADKNERGRELSRSLSAFTTTIQGLINLPPVILYITSLHGALSAQVMVRGNIFTISSRELFLHLALVIVSWMTATWLTLGKQGRGLSELARPMDPEAYLGEGI
ncbi:MAG: hypothetical protein IBX64_02475 [Actinobacteria bacterium]|nr:hypothetical protein [Actinomycetota bacterium]